MSDRIVRTAYSTYSMLLLFLAIIVYCDGRSFDWGNNKQRYRIADEDQIITQDVRMPGVHPNKDDVYMCTSVQMPRQDAYIINFEPHATMKKAHHMLLYGCADITSSPGQAYQCMSMGVCKGQSSIMFAWARDAPAPSIPEGVGFYVGGRSNIKYVTLQIHYGHHDAFKDGEEDNSGIKLSMTFTPQPYLAGIYLLVSGDINVPSHSHNVHSDIACEYQDNVPIYPFAFRTHAHELGKVISGYLIKGDSRGSWLEIAKGDPNWPQAFYPMQPGIEIKRGDWLTARCTYSSDREDTTGVGPTGEDEMCNLYLMYYTDAEFGKSFSMCGTAATGDLKTHFPANSDIPPDTMPAMVEQPPAGQDNTYYPYDTYDNYPYPVNDYRTQLQNIFDNDNNYPSANYLDLNRNGWPDDEEVGLDNKLPETEKPSKAEEISTPATALDKSSQEKTNEEDEKPEEPKEDVHSGKLTLADWGTDDSVTLGQVAGVAVDAEGNVHVFHRVDRVWDVESFDAKNGFAQADDGPITNNTVIAFNPDTGKLMHQWGAKVDAGSDCASCYNGFYLPHGLSIDHEGNLWLTDVALHQVFKFPPGGAETPLLTLGEKLVPGPDKDHFCKPADVAVDPSTGNFFVADGYCNSRIMKFSPQGDFLMEWGKVSYKSTGFPSDAFLIPHSLTYLKDRDVLCVADREHGRIQCFNSGDGTYVDSYHPSTFGSRVFAVHYNPWNGGVLYAVNGPSAERVPVQGFTLSYEKRNVLQTWKPGDAEFQNPHDVECSADNTAVYVAEIGPNKVWKFNVDIGSCSSKPCHNGGICVPVNKAPGYICACPNGFVGLTCQIKTYNKCTECANGGTCNFNSANRKYMCACVKGYSGPNCEDVVIYNTCSECSNGATCYYSEANKKYMCTCMEGYAGEFCQHDITSVTTESAICQPNSCFNQGTCYASYPNSGYLCVCDNGYHGANCQYVNIVTPTLEETDKKEETVGNQVSAKSSKPGNPVIKSYQTQEAGLQAQTDEEINGHKISATDANTATTAIIVAVLAVPIVLMMMVAVAVRLRAQGKMKFGGNGLRTGYSSTADRFSLGNFFNRRKGFNQVSTEDSDHDGGMEWSEESDIEEYSILNSKTSQNL